VHLLVKRNFDVINMHGTTIKIINNNLMNLYHLKEGFLNSRFIIQIVL